MGMKQKKVENGNVKIKIKVKEFAARIGVNLKDLGPMVGVKKETVYKWSDGSNTPTFEVVYKLKRLGMTDYELFGETFAEQESFIMNRVINATHKFLDEIKFKNQKQEVEK